MAYNLPIWRGAFKAVSPDGKYVAEISSAMEVSMGNPTYGTLRLSNGLQIQRCNPSFVWSDDSMYLAVPRFYDRFGLFRRQHVLVVSIQSGLIFRSLESTYYFQPESFVCGSLRVKMNPFRRPAAEIVWQIPADLSSRFTRVAASKLAPSNSA